MDFDKTNMIYELEEKWQEMLNSLYEEEFDSKVFSKVFKQTFDLFSDYKFSDDDIPRQFIDLLMTIKEYSCMPIWFSEESDASKVIARSICYQMGYNGFMAIDGEFPVDKFVVERNDGCWVAIDVNSIDYSALVNDEES